MAIDFSLDDGIAVITINRPEVHNALDAEHYDLLSKAWIRVRDDADVRVAVVTGAGARRFAPAPTFAVSSARRCRLGTPGLHNANSCSTAALKCGSR